MKFARLLAVATLTCVAFAQVTAALAAEPPPPPPPAATDAAPPPPPPAEGAAAPATADAPPPPPTEASSAPAGEAPPPPTGEAPPPPAGGQGSSVAARIHSGPTYPPTVTGAVQGSKLVLTFPAGVIKESVSFKVHHLGVTRQRIEDNPKAFTWTSDTELTADLDRLHHHHCHHHRRGKRRHHHHCHHHHGADWHKADGKNVNELWVWGQLKTGEALLQKVNIAQ
jgi:hypothetical protein